MKSDSPSPDPQSPDSPSPDSPSPDPQASDSSTSDSPPSSPSATPSSTAETDTPALTPALSTGDGVAVAVPAHPLQNLLIGLEAWGSRASDWLNPILIKEARQALKSHQFVVTFCLVLGCAWGWSFLGVAMFPSLFYVPGGRYMLIGYYVVLALPMLVVVPFSAFRSLAIEREDGTFELLSITGLSARQIITGKLGSAIVQMLVYYSALSPCIVFTYLLRGIDIVSIVLLLAYTFLASLLLSTIGLAIATATHSRQWHVFLSVALLGGLFCSAIGFSALMISFIELPVPLDEADFWISNLAGISFYVTYIVMFLLAAAAQISFASDNRSTRLRVVMLVQQLLIVGWTYYVWQRVEETVVLNLIAGFAGLHWLIMGALLCGENAQLAPRVLRTLPRTFLGRMAFTWFNPGSGTGYVFVVANLGACVVAALVGASADLMGGKSDWESVFQFSIMVWAYVIVFLGIGRILLALLQQFFYVGIVVSILIQILLFVGGIAVPFVFHYAINGLSTPSYWLLFAPNVPWTLVEAGEGDLFQTPGVIVVVLLMAMSVLLVNLVLTCREVAAVRMATPERVEQDDRELHPERFTRKEERVPKNPWTAEQGAD